MNGPFLAFVPEFWEASQGVNTVPNLRELCVPSAP